ncbi:nucleotidyl transferase AbiEii/AbiGii toxin family protein [Nocardia sp. NPDC057353]|uniref:nucleotidyl transferase AbiEii/AbiGii toxin family protein n=1 Tax=Nocardia sp. NPDC057353 TaxID=3346104 RepID=UPI003629991E
MVELAGPSMAALVHAIPETERRAGRPITVIGGLAVICRVASPHRATSDLDTVHRRCGDEPSQLEVLVASTGRASGPAGVLIPTPEGEVQVDVLEVSDADFDPLPEDPTGRLHVLSHSWAAETASPLRLRARGSAAVTVAVAEPGSLIAMKLQSAFDRGARKEATDLLDIVRLSTDRACGATARSQLAAAAQVLRRDATQHLDLFFEQRVARTARLIREIPEGRDAALDDLVLVHELLSEALRS